MKVVRIKQDAFGRALETETYEKACIRQLDSHFSFVPERFELRVDDHPIAMMQGGRSYLSLETSISNAAIWVDGFVVPFDLEGDVPFTREHWSVHP